MTTIDFSLSRPALAPPLRPVPEWRAEGSLRDAYAALRAAMQVPWVGVINQALAHYEAFYLGAWRCLAPAVASRWFAERSAAIARAAVDGMAALQPDDLAARLVARGYGERELDAIRGTLDVLNHGNPQYFIYATAVRYALAGAALGRDDPVACASPRAGGAIAPHWTGGALVMVEEHHALGDLRVLYAEIKRGLDLPFVNSDYKALARWPNALAEAWAGLAPRLDTAAYRDLRERLQGLAVQAAHELPVACSLGADTARALGVCEAQLAELREVIALFQWLLSGLIVNVTWIRASLR
ncbi:MAG: hypothetical protein JNJ89_01810 [Rubrivivax sp.]|nr:hypothetical protein [Rubrivivax sp.]